MDLNLSLVFLLNRSFVYPAGEQDTPSGSVRTSVVPERTGRHRPLDWKRLARRNPTCHSVIAPVHTADELSHPRPRTGSKVRGEGSGEVSGCCRLVGVSP